MRTDPGLIDETDEQAENARPNAPAASKERLNRVGGLRIGPGMPAAEIPPLSSRGQEQSVVAIAPCWLVWLRLVAAGR